MIIGYKCSVKCPYCSSSETKVLESRINQLGETTRRRRECPQCSGRFTTYERVEEIMPEVVKKDGRRETFTREKLKAGIQKSCQKRSVPTHRIEESLQNIEQQVQSLGLKEVPSTTLGELVMNELHRLDKVAYIRFASVYREFCDVEEFVAELKENTVEGTPS